MATSFIQDVITGPLQYDAGKAIGDLISRSPVPATPSAIQRRPKPEGFTQTPLPRVSVGKTSVDDASAADSFRREEGDGPQGVGQPLSSQYDYNYDVTPIIGGPKLRETIVRPKEPDFGLSYVQYLVEGQFGSKKYYDPITGTTKYEMPGSMKSVLATTGLSAFAGIGEGISRANLERIAKNAYIGKDGYAVATLGGRTIGVSPGPFGGYTLSGVLPNELSATQRREITNKLLEISKTPEASGRYMGPDPTPTKAGQTQEESDAGAGVYTPPSLPETALEAQEQSFQYGYTPEVTYTTDPGQEQEAASRGSGVTKTDWSAPASNSPYSEAGRGNVGYYMADGGEVQSTGFVDGPPQNYSKGMTVADTENTQVREGSFVINAPATEKLQAAGILPSKQKKAAAKGGKMVDVALSKGEYVVDRDDIEEYGGYSFLNSVNDAGKPEVDRRQAASGGMIRGYQKGGDVTGMPPLAAGFRPAIDTSITPQGFISATYSTPETAIPADTINGINLEDVGMAISRVETKGYQDRNQGYFYTRSDSSRNPSSAFGPLQITGDTLKAMSEEFDELRIQKQVDPEFAAYLDKFATDARNRTNYRRSGKIYTGEIGKKATGRKATPQEALMYQNLGTGSISVEDHKKYYPLLGKLYLRYKAQMSDSEEDLVRRHFGNTKSTAKYRAAKAELGID